MLGCIRDILVEVIKPTYHIGESRKLQTVVLLLNPPILFRISSRDLSGAWPVSSSQSFLVALYVDFCIDTMLGKVDNNRR